MFDAECIWVIPSAIALATSIIVCELSREPPSKGFDLLRAINALYFTLYVFCPIVLVNAPVIDVGSWNYIYDLRISGRQLAIAELIAFLSYLFFIAGFVGTRSLKFANHSAQRVRAQFTGVSNTDASRWAHLGNILFAIGLASLIKYTIVIGGVWNLLTWGMLYRSTPMPTDSAWVFLKNVVLLTGPASLFYYAWAQMKGGTWRWALFALSVLVSLLALFHHGGRLQLFFYLFTFPIASALMGRGLRFTHFFAAFVVGGILIFVGKEILFLVYNPNLVSMSVGKAADDIAAVLYRVTLEFSFPILTLAKATQYVPIEEGFRWFVDFYYSVISLLPQRVFGGETPRTVTLVVLEMEKTPNPADLLSFGYFSLGIPGCFIIAFAYGIVSRLIETALGAPLNRMQAVLGVSWILFWAFRLMYGDPSLTLLGGFHLLFATILLLAWRGEGARPRAVGDV